MQYDDIKDKMFGNNTVGFCLKDKSGKVLFQNNLSIELCGNQSMKICDKGCMLLYEKEIGGKTPIGSQVFHSKDIDNELCDVILINDGEQLITFLVVLKDKIESDIEYFKKYKLSAREIEVLELVLKGQSNPEIAKALFISKSTLKTHLNKIYKKIPDHVFTIRRKK